MLDNVPQARFILQKALFYRACGTFCANEQSGIITPQLMEDTMPNRQNNLSRRDFLKAMGLGAAGAVAAGWVGSGLGSNLLTSVPDALAATTTLALVATDFYVAGRDRHQ